jgi:hypothetical protein
VQTREKLRIEPAIHHVHDLCVGCRKLAFVPFTRSARRCGSISAARRSSGVNFQPRFSARAVAAMMKVKNVTKSRFAGIV